MGKRVCKPPKIRWSPYVGTRNPRKVIGALQTSWVGIGYLMEKKRAVGGGRRATVSGSERFKLNIVRGRADDGKPETTRYSVDDAGVVRGRRNAPRKQEHADWPLAKDADHALVWRTLRATSTICRMRFGHCSIPTHLAKFRIRDSSEIAYEAYRGRAPAIDNRHGDVGISGVWNDDGIQRLG
ncbi:hypothetical protein EVAR_39224_1 [Eumeta japonica]|uniref:Uncharacterized protein n=1 Tax=Eumeta variegata TaxID=151549 RepID=A0A4C1VLS6_EUMVA|nr:hypothetical protein EVAR_39224_1 [Eumeta japonica]